MHQGNAGASVRPKDYLLAAGGAGEDRDLLYFAVLSELAEQGRILSVLRHYTDGQGKRHKLSEEDADQFLRQRYPAYLWRSPQRDVSLHAVPTSKILRVFRPRECARRLLRAKALDATERTAHHLLNRLQALGIDSAQLGISGSMLIGAHGPASDIDLVAYGRDTFFQTRDTLQRMLAQDEVQALKDADWREVWRRRHCELDLPSYAEHERRKGNKYLCQGRRIDLSALPWPEETVREAGAWKKQGFLCLSAVVSEDRHSFDYPARYGLQHPRIPEIVCYTASYAGQARKGERILAAGHVETDPQGNKRLLVGSSRAARGEYILACTARTDG